MHAGVCSDIHQTLKSQEFLLLTQSKIMDAIAGSVVQGLTSLASEEFKLLWNVKDDVERMKNTVEAIRATLMDAEEKANNKNHQVSLWLARLKDVLYDADDLLDDLSTEALRRRIMSGNKVAKEVRIFFSKSNQLVYNLKMAHELREVRERLDEIDGEKKRFLFTDQPLQPLSVLEVRRQTHSFVQEDQIIGREEEKDLILHCALESNVESGVKIIPIVGFGGLGKTTLAQLVYNHEGVQNYFQLRKWVCVSDIFDVKQIAQNILEQGGSKEMEQVQQDIRKLVEGKKFLIVLDDVWNEDAELWHELKSLLAKGDQGSVIIVTTRSEKVGKMMGTYESVILKGLDYERSWVLFCKMAFGEGGEPNDNRELLEIGREIVEKCGGVPLAIKAVGSLVREKILEGITDLSYLRNCELCNVDKSLEDRVFAVLKLSYDHLPSPMKNCVAYCSLFPKDFEFKKQTLIQMWVAEGFIALSNQSRCEEDVGHEYFMNLLSRCFFQDVTTDQVGNIATCKMHDLIHDLAQFVGKHEYVAIRGGKEEATRETTRHCSIEKLDISLESLSSLNFDKSRTLLFNHDSDCFMDDSVFDLVASKYKCLRVLKLAARYIHRIPESIGNLKHLRYLDLSGIRIGHVPKAVTKLLNLQTLNLSYAIIWELPRDISKLVSLKHLHNNGCYQLGWMPRGLGHLTCLRTLPLFVVDEKEMQGRNGSAGIRELGELNNLRGSLTIAKLKNLRSNPKEAESAKLYQKQNLEYLELNWEPASFNSINYYPNTVVADELILESLRPHHTIKSLIIQNFRGEKLPEWIASLRKLQHLAVIHCNNVKSLPQGLRNLTSLRRVRIEDSPLLPDDELKKIDHILV